MWPRIINFALGVWLLAAPSVLGYGGVGRTNDLVVGGIVAVNALLAISAAASALRWVNASLGVWLLLAPWFLGFGWSTMGHRMLAGVLMLSTALVAGNDRRAPASNSGGTPPPAAQG